MANLESTSLAAGLFRVKFSALWKGSVADFLRDNPDVQNAYHKTMSELADAVQLLELSGAAPVAEEDGKVAGNVAARMVINGLDFLVVSKTGKLPGPPLSIEDEFCIVTGFDREEWSLEYYAKDSSTLPTSDSPLHHAVLHAAAEFHWDETPLVSLHGHALETADEAERLGFPCSVEETSESTPDDMYALLSLLKENPFPQHKVFIRKGHGFNVLGKTTSETVETFKSNVVPFIQGSDGDMINLVPCSGPRSKPAMGRKRGHKSEKETVHKVQGKTRASKRILQRAHKIAKHSTGHV